MPKFIEGKAPLVVKKRSIGKEAAGAYFVIKGLIVDSAGEVAEYLVTRFRIDNTNRLAETESRTDEYSEEEFITLISEFGHLFADYRLDGKEYKLRYTEFPVYQMFDGAVRELKLFRYGKERFLACLADDEILFVDSMGEIQRGSVSTLLSASISLSEMLVGSLGKRADRRYFTFVRDYRKSDAYIKESARRRMVGDSCCCLVPSSEQFSLSYVARLKGVSHTGVCSVPSLATVFYCFGNDLDESGVKVISFEKCLGLRNINMKCGNDFRDRIAVVLPSRSLFGAPKVYIGACCKEFRLDGYCKRIELSLTRVEHFEIDPKSLSNAKQVYFAVCRGLKSLTFNRISGVMLYDTDTEEIFCRVPLGVNGFHRGIRIEKCLALKLVRLSSDKFNPSVVGGIFKECDNLEELSIEADSLVRDSLVIDLCSISKKLKRFSLTLTSRFSRDKAILGGAERCEIIAPRGAEVKLEGNGVDLSKYFTVTYK